ncbi:hypothetical protein [Streptomyces sp. NPDC047315]|uniref:hypothetical protein n=1 Tax=Streptomyces sp. NPDC047315 TaxID=3155142 RepID=UPI0033DB1334
MSRVPEEEPGRGQDGVPESRSGDEPGHGFVAEPSALELRLEAELRALGRSITLPDVDGETMAERVLSSLLADQVPDHVTAPAPAPVGRAEKLRAWLHGRLRKWLRQHRRSLTVTLSGTLVALALTPPVRASIMEWADGFDFGGIVVRYDPGRPPPAVDRSAGVPGCGEPLARAEAERKAGFEALVPAELGAPDAFSTTAGPAGRSMLTLCWDDDDGQVTRLDQFPARLDPGFTKTSAEQPEWVPLGDGTGENATGLWFARPHLLHFTLLDQKSARWEERRRTAGPTLLWMSPDGRTTLRLEGVPTLTRAVGIAESLR